MDDLYFVSDLKFEGQGLFMYSEPETTIHRELVLEIATENFRSTGGEQGNGILLTLDEAKALAKTLRKVIKDAELEAV